MKQQDLSKDLHNQFPWKTYTENAVGFHFPKGVRNPTLLFIYRSINSLVPTFIAEPIPPLTGNVSNYDLKNRNNITIPFTRINISYRSCIPSSIALWNSLEENLRTIDSVKGFKTHIKNSSYTHIVPSCYFMRDRYLQYYMRELEIAIAI